MAAGFLLKDASGEYVVTTSSITVAGDFELIICVALDNWATGGNQIMVDNRDGSTDGFTFRIGGGDRFEIAWADSGGLQTENVSGVNMPTLVNGDPYWLRVTIDVSTGDVSFYYSTDSVDTAPGSVSWTHLETDSGAGATSIVDTTSNTFIGVNTTAGGDANGEYYGVWVYDGGTPIMSPDFRDDDQGWSSPPGTDDQSNSWSFQGGITWTAPTGIEVTPPPGILILFGPPPTVEVERSVSHQPPAGVILLFSAGTTVSDILTAAPTPGFILLFGPPPTVETATVIAHQPTAGFVLLFGGVPTAATGGVTHRPPSGLILLFGPGPTLEIVATLRISGRTTVDIDPSTTTVDLEPSLTSVDLEPSLTHVSIDADRTTT